MIISRCRFAVEQRRRSKAGDERQLRVELGGSLPLTRMAAIGALPPFTGSRARDPLLPPLASQSVATKGSYGSIASVRGHDERVRSRLVIRPPGS